MATPDRAAIRRTTSSLAIVAFAAATVALGLDLFARVVEIGAVPALAGYHLQGAVAVFSALVVIGLVVGRADGGQVAAAAASFASAATVLVVRRGGAMVNPSEAALLPVVALPVAALALVVVLGARASARSGGPAPTVGSTASVAIGASAVAGLASLAVGDPVSLLTVGVHEVRLAGELIAGMALVGMVDALRSRRRRDVVRFALAGGGGAGVVAVAGKSADHAARAAILLAAVVIVVAADAFGLTAALARSGRGAARGAGRAGGAVATGATRAIAAVRRALVGAASFVARCWDRTARRAAPAALAPARRVADERGAAAAVVVLTVASIGVRCAWAVRLGWQPTGHASTIMSRAYDVGTANHPLVGMPTSLGSEGGVAHHPGPLLFDYLAPFARLLGVQRGALAAGGLLAIVLWLVAVWAAYRAGGRLAALGAWVVGAAVVHIAAIGVVFDSNNVSITELAVLSTLLLAWAAATGTWGAWPGAVILGSLCAQAYLPHGLIVLGAVLWSGMVLAGAARRTDDPVAQRAIRRQEALGWLLAALAWVQPLIDVLTDRGGNVRSLFSEVSNPRPPVGWSGLWRAVVWVVAVPARWGRVTGAFSTAGTADSFLGGPVLPSLVVLALLGALWWWARSKQPAVDRPLRTVAVLTVLGAAINVTQLPLDHIRAYTTAWLVVVSLFVAYVVAVTLCAQLGRAAPDLARRAMPRLRPALGVVACLLVVLPVLRLPNDIESVKGRPYTIDALLGPLVDDADRAFRPGEELLVVGMDTQLNGVTTDTLEGNLIVRGHRILVEPHAGWYYGRRRRAPATWTGTMLWVTSTLGTVEPAGTRVGRASVPGWSEARYRHVRAQIAARVRRGPELVLQPWAAQMLERYLAPWVPSGGCDLAARVRAGAASVRTLPAGALVSLYADDAVVSPRLPASLASDATAIIGQAPVELWRVPRTHAGPFDSDYLLRDGTECVDPHRYDGSS